MAQLLTHQTPKEQYKKCIQNILQIVMDIPDLSDGSWKRIADETSTMWKLQDSIFQIQRQAIILQQNRYYNRQQEQLTREQKQQEKSTNDIYVCCSACRRIVNKKYLAKHMDNTKVCVDIRLALKVNKRHIKIKTFSETQQKFFNKYYKIIQTINYFVIKHLKNQEIEEKRYNYENRQNA